MTTTIETLLDYYQKLLLYQYQQPNAQGTIEALLGGSDEQHGLLAGAIYNQVRDGFDLDTAIGQQLDFLGELIGVARYFITLDLTKTFWGLPSYSDGSIGSYHGWSSYSLPQPPTWYWMRYSDFTPNTMPDSSYRLVLQFQAAVRSCDFGYETLDNIMYDFFGGYVNLKVTGNMAITYQHLTSDPEDLFEIISSIGILPHPAGVGVTVAEVSSF